VPVVPLSAVTGVGVPELLENILFIAEDKKLSFDPKHAAIAFVIEAKKDRRGIVASAIIKDGTLKIGDTIYVEDNKAKIKSLINDTGVTISEVFPSTPFELLGFTTMPTVGVLITTALGTKAEVVVPEEEKKVFDLNSILDSDKPVEKKLSLVIKCDSHGSLEATRNALQKNPNITIILSAVGDIHKSDIFLAKTSKAIVIGFNSKPDPETKDLAKQEKVIIKTYSIIYELLDELQEVADLLQEKEEAAKNLKGEAKIIATFMIEGEKVFGVKLSKGKITDGDELQVFRADNLIGKCRLVSLKIRAKKVQEVKKDQEAGMILSTPLDIRVGDVVKCIL